MTGKIKIAEADALAEELSTLSLDQQGDLPVPAEDLESLNELKRQLRVLLADCERQLQREC